MSKLTEFIVWMSLVCICIFTALDSSSRIQKAEQVQNLNAEPLAIGESNDKLDISEPDIQLEPGLTIVPPSVIKTTEDCTPENCPEVETYYSRGRLFRWRIR